MYTLFQSSENTCVLVSNTNYIEISEQANIYVLQIKDLFTDVLEKTLRTKTLEEVGEHQQEVRQFFLDSNGTSESC